MAKNYDYCTMIGNPAYYSDEFRDYSPKTIEKLKEHGVNEILVNIAWSRPYIDAVTLEHLAISKDFPLMSDKTEVEKNSKNIVERVKNVHKCGLKAVGLFGLPIYMDYSKLPDEYQVLKGATNSTVSIDNVTCILSEYTLNYYKDLLKQVLQKTDLDKLILYTYDELAEVCDEDSDCPRCKGIPLEERLPGFLNEINAYCKTIKPTLEIFWEPWELSASQVYLCMEKLDKSIGISCHSTIHEVYFVNIPDIWLRNVGMICARQGRKFIVEMFISGSGEDLGPIAGYPCPRLIYDQIKSIRLLEGVTGIKEYFGTAVPFFSVNEKMSGMLLKGDEREYVECVKELAESFNFDEAKQMKLTEAWNLSSQALLMTPWDISWVFRFSNLQPYDLAYWGKVPFFQLMQTPWSTPSWLANRRSYYMVVKDTNLLSTHMIRDFDKRIKLALDYAKSALKIFEEIGTDKSTEIGMQYNAIQYFVLILTARQNYMNLCELLSRYQNGEKNEKEIMTLLEKDIKNAEQFIAFNRLQNVEYYYTTKKSEEGLAYMKQIYTDQAKNLKKYFLFLN